ncbi:MAG: hypothetical protein JWL97_4243 [Gemmatimonadales bacterium]|nr:hypothetical protein [Gemmatimonadales bacterium]
MSHPETTDQRIGRWLSPADVDTASDALEVATGDCEHNGQGCACAERFTALAESLATPATLPDVDIASPLLAAARGRVLAEVYAQLTPGDEYAGPGDIATFAVADLLHAAIADGQEMAEVFLAAARNVQEEHTGRGGSAETRRYFSLRIRAADPAKPVSKTGHNDLLVEVLAHDELVTITEHQAPGSGNRFDVDTYHDLEGLPGGELGATAWKLWGAATGEVDEDEL